jgi:hypothetical protein
MELTFNIIFVPGTVRYLRLATSTLLDCSSYRYRLISNGLGLQEMSLLEEFCRRGRLEYCAYPTKTTVSHGTLLSWLLQRERGDYFCFMDSDIFASAPFGNELEGHLAHCDIFSSCSHLGIDPTKQLTGLEGRCLRAPNGFPLATTFFCVSKSQALRDLIAETGVGFERYSYPQHFPGPVKERLRQVGLPADCEYDTGKLLSVLAHARGLRLKYEPLDGLSHIGGIGKYIMKSARRGLWKQRLGHIMQRPLVLRDKDLEPSTWRRFKLRSLAHTHDDADPLNTWKDARQAKLQRRYVALFFAAFLRFLFDGDPQPVLAISDQALALRINTLCNVIRRAFYSEFEKTTPQDLAQTG